MLIGLAALAVLASATDWRAALRAIGPATLAAIAVAVAFAVAGFYWLDGYTLVQQRYWQGIAKDRPFQYGVGQPGVRGVRDRAGQRRRNQQGVRLGRHPSRSGIHLLLLAC